jgi:5'-3' exonuclease
LKQLEDNVQKLLIVQAMQCLADIYEKNNPSSYEQALELQSKATTIHNDMVVLIIEYMHSNNIQFIQAPFEADPQLVYLLENGFGDYILIEDSDVFALGAKNWITHLNINNGHCVSFLKANRCSYFCSLAVAPGIITLVPLLYFQDVTLLQSFII